MSNPIRCSVRRSRLTPLCIAICALLGVFMLASCSEDADDSAIDTAGELRQALESAASGDTVALAEGSTIAGTFVVPDGVVLEGHGATLLGPGSGAALFVNGGSVRATRVADLHVVHGGGGGVVAYGGGQVALEDITIDVEAGFGLLIEGIEGLTLNRVQAHGSAGAEMLDQIGNAVDPELLPLVGVMVADSDVRISDLQISGFAGFGAVLFDSSGVVSGLSVADCIGIGVLVEGDSQITLEDSQVERSYSGGQPGQSIFAVGVAIARGAHLETRDLTIDSVGGVGVLQDGATSANTNLSIANSDHAGVWLQNIYSDQLQHPALRIEGTSSIATNTGMGIFARDVVGIDVEGLTVSDTANLVRIVDGFTPVSFGDGVHLVGVSGAVRLADTRVVGNPRVGVLVDGTSDANLPLPTFEFGGNVSIEAGTLDAQPLGLIVQNASMIDRTMLADSITIGEELEARDVLQSNPLNIQSAFETTISVEGIIGDGLIGEDGFMNPEGDIRPGSVADEVFIVIEIGG